eukprot:TRINITY_DN149_c0_g2_i3.p1 TRINITY_DN149_c0_g2~~TRINITY_DN149_c0_g2_i3.p1  ORF type:complete len:176 (+),score=32.58 TRINITY_DN149_c0_g2_i3:318-845(+)
MATELNLSPAGEPKARKVVISVDEGEESLEALRWALRNVVQGDDKVHVVHAQPLPEVYGGPMPGPVHHLGAGALYMPPEYLETVKSHQDAQSKAIVIKAKDICTSIRNDIKVEGDVIVGEPREGICSAVEQLNADLLVMGSHGYGAVKRALLGSVSDYCIHHAKCPVVVVRHKAP